MSLRLDWCSLAAARYALSAWYSRSTFPSGKTARIGVWEDRVFKGVIIFGSGANGALGASYGLAQIQCCEMLRVALDKHQTPVSRILRISTQLIHRAFPGLRLIVTFADPTAGHHGGIYQAAGWIYTGKTTAASEYIFHGLRYHGRGMRQTLTGLGMMHDPQFGRNTLERIRLLDPAATEIMGTAKHRYVLPLDGEMRKQLASIAKPYPKRVGSDTGDTAGVQPAEDGSTPIPTLHPICARPIPAKDLDNPPICGD